MEERAGFYFDASEHIPVNAYVMVPSSVPATDIDTNGAGKFLAEDMLPFKAKTQGCLVGRDDAFR